jgi:ribosomal protein S21
MASAKRASVKVREWESFSKVWKRFEKACDDADIINDYRKHEFHEKPSSKKKRNKSFAIAREKRRQSEEQSSIKRNEKVFS